MTERPPAPGPNTPGSASIGGTAGTGPAGPFDDGLAGVTVLVVEDGDEYLEHLSRFVAGPRYLQAHDGGAALTVLGRERIDLVYLDMRFDRIPESALFGDHAAATHEHGGDAVRAWKFLQHHQGLFILAALAAAGFGRVPVILAYDFTGEPARAARLAAQHPNMRWVRDTLTPDDIRGIMRAALGSVVP